MILKNIFKRKEKHTYKNCKTIPMYNFYEILATNNYKWVLMNYNDNSDVDISEKENNRLKLIFQDIFNEYLELKKDEKVLKTLKQRAIIANLENRFFWGVTLSKLYLKNKSKETLESLKSWKFKVNESDDLNSIFDSLNKQLKALRTKINLEKSTFNKLTKDNNVKKDFNIEKQAINVAKGLDLKYPINTKETTMLQWIAYCENLEHIIKENKKKQDNG